MKVNASMFEVNCGGCIPSAPQRILSTGNLSTGIRDWDCRLGFCSLLLLLVVVVVAVAVAVAVAVVVVVVMIFVLLIIIV